MTQHLSWNIQSTFFDLLMSSFPGKFEGKNKMIKDGEKNGETEKNTELSKEGSKILRLRHKMIRISVKLSLDVIRSKEN